MTISSSRTLMGAHGNAGREIGRQLIRIVERVDLDRPVDEAQSPRVFELPHFDERDPRAVD